jgi:hypothetical protein
LDPLSSRIQANPLGPMNDKGILSARTSAKRIPRSGKAELRYRARQPLRFIPLLTTATRG